MLYNPRKLVSRLLLKARASTGQMAVRNRFTDIRERIKTESPVIVDGGANTGQTIDRFLASYRSPVIHAFEPIPDAVRQLSVKYRSKENIHIHSYALGAEKKTVSFHVTDNLVSSSILKPTALNRAYHGTRMDIQQTITVQQVRLDDILEGEIDIVKLDLQGYELEALEGCGQLLERIKIVDTEIEFVPLYEGQSLFGDIDVFLRKRGFRLLNLYGLWTHPDGQLTAGDAVYLNSRYS
jgi:FkbM family methyltransferase